LGVVQEAQEYSHFPLGLFAILAFGINKETFSPGLIQVSVLKTPSISNG
jgi:hypothetical protein